jgi:Iap family predicted aminopeptidase
MQRRRPLLRAGVLCAWLLPIGCAAPGIDTSCLDRVYQGASVGQVPRDEVEAGLEALERTDAARAASIERLFREAGCEANLSLERILATELPNVICRLPGRSATTIVVGAHYDKVDVGDGAADNWSGAALLASLYRSLATRERRHSFEFIAFGAEEDGLIGSRGHVQALDKAQRRATLAMVNLDTLGLGSMKVEKRGSDPALLCYLLGTILLLDANVQLVNVDGVGTSDFLPFRKAGIPAISIHSIAQDTLRVLHSADDTLAALDRAAYYETYRVVALYLAVLDENLEAPDAVSGAALPAGRIP